MLHPARGMGNFLYVTLELLKSSKARSRFAGEARRAQIIGLDRETVDPHQFLGLEFIPRAAAIAELVVWIGYLQRHYCTATATPPSRSCAPSRTSISATPSRLRRGADLGRLSGDDRVSGEERKARRDLLEPAPAGLARGGVHRGEPAVHRRQGPALAHRRTATRRRCGRRIRT